MIRDIPLWLIHQVAMSSAGTGRGKEAAQVGFRVTGSQSIQSARPLIRHAATAHRLSCLSYIAQLPPRNPCSLLGTNLFSRFSATHSAANQ